MENGAKTADKKHVDGVVKKTRDEKLHQAKIEEQLLKSLNATPDEDKFQTLLKKCVESERINKTLLLSQKQNQKLFESIMTEKDALQAEYSRTVLTK